jgi:hypothetical protein
MGEDRTVSVGSPTTSSAYRTPTSKRGSTRVASLTTTMPSYQLEDDGSYTELLRAKVERGFDL